MRFWKPLVPTVLAIAIALAAFSAPVSAAIPAPVPKWTQGQSVGYGTNLDLGGLADTYLLSPIRSNPSLYNITSIKTLNVTGSLDIWEVDQVAQVTSEVYTLAMQSAQGLKLHADVNLTLNNLPVAGTYRGTLYGTLCIPPTIPLGTGTVAATLDATSLSTTKGTRILQVSDLAYVNETQNVAEQARVVFTGYHLPTTSTNDTACTETVSYDSPTFSLTVNTQDQVRATYTPALDYFHFPIADNNTWWANTTATIGATLSGTVDAKGMSSHDEQAFFDNLTQAFQGRGLVATGMSSFPIDLAKVTIMAGTSYIVHNGLVTDYPVPLDASYRATASVQTLSDGGQHPVYLITDAAYSCPGANLTSLPIGYAAVYAPDFPATGAGMIVGYQLLVCGLGMSLPGFALTNTKPADAQQQIGRTETNYQTAPPPSRNAAADFFLQAPYWGFLLIVVVVVAALLAMRRRRRPVMTPPRAQSPRAPPSPPPPAPPGGPGNP